ncbi:MAG: recombination protein RecR [Flavobacteriaceae bacterium]|jgi:recombination protein RecR
MNPIEKLTELFRKFPGVGEKQARRFTYFLLRTRPDYIEQIQKGILDIRNNIISCTRCFKFFEKKDNGNICGTCSQTYTSQTLMVVANDIDQEILHSTDTYKGMYFILGGTIPFGQEDIPAYIRLPLLKKRITEDRLSEIILAFPFTTPGEYTEMRILDELQSLCREHDIILSRLGKGMSAGTELEYIDPKTFSNALENRK